MPDHTFPHRCLLVMALGFGLVTGCGVADPTPITPSLTLSFADPVVARFEPATGIFVAEFPVTITDAQGPGGNLSIVETTVFNRSRGVVVVRNQRPNTSYTYPDVRVPPRASLTVEAGVGFAPPPPRDEILVTVRVRLTDDREVERTTAISLPF